VHGSLFLRAKGPYKLIRGRKDQVRFAIEDGKYKIGRRICVANSTYDLTFKSLFLGGGEGLASAENAMKRLMSLLNSLCYPNAENDPNEPHIIRIETVNGELITKCAIKSKVKTNSDFENQLGALRCDIVCKCIVQSQLSEAKQTIILYFDIEMQRKNIPGRIDEFLVYQHKLQGEYKDGEVKVVAFLDYKTEEAVERTAFRRVIEKSDGTIVLAENAKKELYPMISLKVVVKDILEGKDVEIVAGQPIGEKGKEWLKLLGIRHWAQRKCGDPKDKRCQYYIVPAVAKGYNPELAEALRFLQEENLADKATEFQGEVDKVFDAKRTAKNLQKEGEKLGEKLGEIKGEIKGLFDMFIGFGSISGQKIQKMQSAHRLFPRGLVEKIGNDYIEESGMTEEQLNAVVGILEREAILSN
jgi:hypothetical protein